MKTRNELFLEAVDYLIDEGLASDSSDVAQKAGLGPNLISRVRTGKVKSVSDDSIRALAARFNLNMDYFRGKSEYITRYDQASANMDRELEEAQRLLNKDSFPSSSQPIDHSSLVNAILAAKDETIAALRSQLEEKDVTIQSLRQQISDLRQMKDQMDDTLTAIDGIKNQLAMVLSVYGTPNASSLLPTSVNDEPEDLHTFKLVTKKNGKKDLIAVVPQGLIRGGRSGITEELIKKAVEVLNHSNQKK